MNINVRVSQRFYGPVCIDFARGVGGLRRHEKGQDSFSQVGESHVIIARGQRQALS